VLLSGWKEISEHLRCGVRTAQRYEHAGLPITRPLPGRRSHVIADSEQLDGWLLEGSFRRNRDFERLSVIQRTRELRGQVQQSRKTLRHTLELLVEELTALRMTAYRALNGRTKH
jgi:hypothetical protein